MSIHALTDNFLERSNGSVALLEKVAAWRSDPKSSCIVCVAKSALISPALPVLIVAAVVEAVFRLALGLLLVGFIPLFSLDFRNGHFHTHPFAQFVFNECMANSLTLIYTPALVMSIFRNCYARTL